MGFKGDKVFRRKKLKYTSSIDQTTPWNTRNRNAAIDDRLRNREEINCRKNEKSIQVETVGTLQD